MNRSASNSFVPQETARWKKQRLKCLVAASFVLILRQGLIYPMLAFNLKCIQRWLWAYQQSFPHFLHAGIKSCILPYWVYILPGIKFRCSTNWATFSTLVSTIFKSKYIKITFSVYAENKIQNQFCIWAAQLSSWECGEENICLEMASCMGKQTHTYVFSCKRKSVNLEKLISSLSFNNMSRFVLWKAVSG